MIEIPQRFIDGCEGDLKEARRRWDITRHWRETEGNSHLFQLFFFNSNVLLMDCMCVQG